MVACDLLLLAHQRSKGSRPGMQAQVLSSMPSFVLAALIISITVQATSRFAKSFHEPNPRIGMAMSKPTIDLMMTIEETSGYDGEDEVEDVDCDYSAFVPTSMPCYRQANLVDLTDAILEYNKDFKLPEAPEDSQFAVRQVQETSVGTFVFYPENGVIMYYGLSGHIPVVTFYPYVPENFSIQAGKYITCMMYEDDAEILKYETLRILRRK
jgi:hypothetical protein